jgi:hypothetical protein
MTIEECSLFHKKLVYLQISFNILNIFTNLFRKFHSVHSIAKGLTIILFEGIIYTWTPDNVTASFQSANFGMLSLKFRGFI